MEREIGEIEFDDLMGTNVVCRSGNPIKVTDLDKVSVSRARAIIVLGLDRNDKQSDARALEVVLALAGLQETPTGHIVVEVRDRFVGRQITSICGGIQNILVYDLVGRLMPQCSLQRGLAQVWEDLLGFENAGFYVKRWPELDNRPFREAVLLFPDAIPIGVMRDETRRIILNPSENYILQKNDELLVIANDDNYAPDLSHSLRTGPLELPPLNITDQGMGKNLLICGWHRDAGKMIMELHALLRASGVVQEERLQVLILNELIQPESWRRKLQLTGFDKRGMDQHYVKHQIGNPRMRQDLDAVDNLSEMDYIWIFEDDFSEDSVYSRSLITLLFLTDMEVAGQIITEMHNHITKDLVKKSVSGVSSDFLISSKLESSILAMLAKDRRINDALEDLFSQENNKLCFKHQSTYLNDAAARKCSFYRVMLTAFHKNDIVIGYRMRNSEPLVINPPNKLSSMAWDQDCLFVVISRCPDQGSTSDMA